MWACKRILIGRFVGSILLKQRKTKEYENKDKIKSVHCTILYLIIFQKIYTNIYNFYASTCKIS